MKLISWNVNGIRAVHRKEIFLPFLRKQKPDILCLQETKAHAEQLPEELLAVEGYYASFSKPARKGYSGVAIYSKQKPTSVTTDLGVKKFDQEGRILAAEYKNLILYNVYFPNGASGDHRQEYKMAFHEHFLRITKRQVKAGKKVVVCGDVNIAHNEIDIWDPADGEDCSGFLPDERAWMDKWLAAGFIDTFRTLYPKKAQFTWWDYRTGARDRNDGWRIDYFVISENLKNRLKSASIMTKAMGSDHCPIYLEI